MSINPDIFRPSQNYYIEEESVGLLVIDSIVDIIFFIDIIFNFHTSFVSNTGEVITNEKKIRRSVDVLNMSNRALAHHLQPLPEIWLRDRPDGLSPLRCSQCFQSEFILLHQHFQHPEGLNLIVLFLSAACNCHHVCR